MTQLKRRLILQLFTSSIAFISCALSTRFFSRIFVPLILFFLSHISAAQDAPPAPTCTGGITKAYCTANASLSCPLNSYPSPTGNCSFDGAPGQYMACHNGCTCPAGYTFTSSCANGICGSGCVSDSGSDGNEGTPVSSSSAPACDGDPSTIEICEGSDNSSSDSGNNSSEPSSVGSGSSSGSGSDSSTGSGSGSSTGTGDNGSGDIPDENSSTGNPGSGGDSGGGSGGGGGGSGNGGTGSTEYDTCLLTHDPAFCDSAFSSSSLGQDCLPGYHYYPNTYTCVPDTSSSSSSFQPSSSSSTPSSSSQSSSSSSSQSSQNFSSSSSWFIDHNGETPIDESDPCPNKYQDNQGQWWCINNSGSNSSGAASSSGGASAADCKAQPSCDGDPVQCAILKQVWINLCDGVDKATPVDSDGDIKAMDDEFDRLINSEQLQLDEDGTLSSIKHTRIDLSKKEFGLDQLDTIANEGTSAQCPSPISLNLSLGSFEVSFQPLCDLADQLHYLVVFIFSYIASVIIYRAIERA